MTATMWMARGQGVTKAAKICLLKTTPPIRTLSSSKALLDLAGEVKLTSERYPRLARGQFASLEEADLQRFRDILGPGRVLTSSDEVSGYNTDWLRTVRGQTRCVLRPRDTQEVSSLLAHCGSRGLAVCPQGGNTGLVGGSVPVFDEVVISTGLMTNIESVDPSAGVAVCQAGVVLETLDSALADQGMMVPLDLGAKGSCHIGGNVSTNAGGLRLLRYGSLHGSVLGVEAVLASGEIVDCLSSMKKDNTGYDLKHLFIGSEGTLGLVTRVSISCPTRPRSVNLAFLSLPDFPSVLDTFRECKGRLGEILSSCEFIDAGSMDCVTQNLNLTCPLEPSNFYMLIETSGSKAEHDEEKLNLFLEEMLEKGSVSDGTVAAAPGKQKELWQLRERIAEALLKDGYCYKYDISLPLSVFYDSVTVMRERLEGKGATRVVGYGHVGDGNMHLNITTPEYSQEVMDGIEPFLYEWTSGHRGSISAEHGLGFKKRNFIHFSKSDSAVFLMKQIKQVFDPKGIMNPYKVLPDQ